MSYTTEQIKKNVDANIEELQTFLKLKTGLFVVNISTKSKSVFFQTKKNGFVWGYFVSFNNWKHTEDYEKNFKPYIYTFFKNNCINGEESLLILSQFLHDLNKEFC